MLKLREVEARGTRSAADAESPTPPSESAARSRRPPQEATSTLTDFPSSHQAAQTTTHTQWPGQSKVSHVSPVPARNVHTFAMSSASAAVVRNDEAASSPAPDDNDDDSNDVPLYHRLSFRAGVASDVPTLAELFNTTLPLPTPPPFFDALSASLLAGVPAATFSARGFQRVHVELAVDSEHLVGAAVVATISHRDARRGAGASSKQSPPLLPCDILEDGDERALLTNVLLLAVLPRYRRMRIGSELITSALSAVALDDARVKVAFLHARAGDGEAAAFYEENDFERLGVIPASYVVDGAPAAAALWVRALAYRDARVVVYEAPRGGGPIDLASPTLRRHKPLPKWVRDLLFHFVLPSLVVALLFLICYALVLLGPLRGISGVTDAGPPRKSGANRGSGGSGGGSTEL